MVTLREIEAAVANLPQGEQEALLMNLASKLRLQSTSHEGCPPLPTSKSDALRQIDGIKEQLSLPDWDGTEAAPIKGYSASAAQSFIRMLPEGVPLPEFAPEPDGSISMDWIKSRHRLFSVSIGSCDRLAYAWLDGTDKGHGVARFDGTSIPNRILDGIKATMGGPE